MIFDETCGGRPLNELGMRNQALEKLRIGGNALDAQIAQRGRTD